MQESLNVEWGMYTKEISQQTFETTKPQNVIQYLK